MPCRLETKNQVKATLDSSTLYWNSKQHPTSPPPKNNGKNPTTIKTKQKKKNHIKYFLHYYIKLENLNKLPATQEWMHKQKLPTEGDIRRATEEFWDFCQHSVWVTISSWKELIDTWTKWNIIHYNMPPEIFQIQLRPNPGFCNILLRLHQQLWYSGEVSACTEPGTKQ